MIIYGSRGKKLASEAIADPCPSCGKRELQLELWQRYAHVFWIPAFPMKKIGVTQCQHCRQVVENKNFNSNINESYKTVKAQHKTPIWMFSFLALVVIVVGLLAYSNKKDQENTKAHAAAPKEGDIFEMKLGGEYTIFRVESVTADSVTVAPHMYATTKRSGLSKLRERTTEFSNEFIGYARGEIVSMVAAGQIDAIIR